MANRKNVALVTGSNRGIGFETARQLGQQGVTVIVSARAEREAAEAASKLRSEGIEAEAIALDVTNAADRTAAAKFIESHYGKQDILVNNGGVGPTDGLIGLRASASTESELQSIFNINRPTGIGREPAFDGLRHRIPALPKDAGKCNSLLLTDGPNDAEGEVPALGKGNLPWNQIFGAAEGSGGVKFYLLTHGPNIGSGTTCLEAIKTDLAQYQVIHG